MKRTATILVFAAALVALGGSAKAALIEMDWKIPGDKQITRDTVNNLDWLDFDASTGYSVNQVKNTGAAGSDVITRFTTSPCTQADEEVLMGYLTANVPAGFTPGDQAPLYGDVNVEAGPTVGFNFPVGNPFFGIPNSYIAPGKSSRVLYIQSSLAPGLVMGNVINGGVHTAQVVGPVSEPATMGVLALGGLFALVRRRRSRGA